MPCQVIIERKAGKEAEKIPVKFRTAIDKAILSLASNPRPANSKKITEKEGYRVRIGDYRVLYTIDDKAKTVVVYRIKIKGKSVCK